MTGMTLRRLIRAAHLYDGGVMSWLVVAVAALVVAAVAAVIVWWVA